MRYAALAARERSIVDALVAGDTWSPAYFSRWLERHPQDVAVPVRGHAAEAQTVALAEGPRRIEAEFIRNILRGKIDHDIGDPVRIDESGVHLEDAHIVGVLDLAAFVFAKPLVFKFCTFESEVVLTDAILGRVCLEGCTMPALCAERVRVAGVMSLVGMQSGYVRLHEAQIDGSLDISRSVLTGEPPGHACQMRLGEDVRRRRTLNCADADIRGNVELDFCEICGEARFVGSTIGGNFFADDASLSGVNDGRALMCRDIALDGGLYMRRANVSGRINCDLARIGALVDCSHSEINGGLREAISFQWAKLGSSVRMESMKVTGLINFNMAKIAGSLRCSRSHLTAPKQLALNCANVTFDVSVFLSNTEVQGMLNFSHARIGARLYCTGAHWSSPRESDGRVLNCDSAKIAGSVRLNRAKDGVPGTAGFTAKGMCYFHGAWIGGNLRCTGGHFDNGDQTSIACSHARIEGNLYLNDGFHSFGELFFRGVTVKGNVYCQRGTFDCGLTEDSKPEDKSLRDAIDFEGAHICKTLYLTNIERFHGSLDLQDAYAKNLSEDGSMWRGDGKARWAEGVNGPCTFKYVSLDRFVFDGFSDDARQSDDDGKAYPGEKKMELGHKARLRFLERQPPEWLRADFRPQPFTRCAKVLLNMGNTMDARMILYKREVYRLRHSEVKKVVKFLHWLVFGITSGYGYRNSWAVCWLAIVWVVGGLVFSGAHHYGLMHPSSDNVLVSQYYLTKHEPPPDYQPFTPWLYALDVMVPMVDFGQKNTWIPNVGPVPSAALVHDLDVARSSYALLRAGPHSSWLPASERVGAFLSCVPSVMRELEIFIGWFFTTIVLAGLTGLLGHKSDQ